MNITRRIALVAGAASIALPRMAHALTPSPFLRVFEGSAVMRRIAPAPWQSQVWNCRPLPSRLEQPPETCFENFTVTPVDGIRVTSVEEAEDRLLDLIPEPGVVAYFPCPKPMNFFCGDGMVSLPIAINCNSNLICVRTRMARPNIALVSPDALDILSDSDYFGGGGTFYPVPKQTIGRWTHVGRLLYDLEIFVGDHPMLKDQVILMLANEDNHAAVIRSDAGLHLVIDPPEAKLGLSQDFFNNVGFERI
jgi:hypothetical protein